MDYKALEDLVNILVRKTGLELKNNHKNEEKKELEEKLDDISSRVFLLTSEDALESDYLEKEKELILKCLNEEHVNAVTYAEKIMKAFEEGKPYSNISKILEKLVSLSKEELEKTHSEINNTNIFTEMERYNKIIDSHKKEIESNEYRNNSKNNLLVFMRAYKNSKIRSLQERKTHIPKQIEALNKIIEELKSICDKLKFNRAVSMKKLSDIKCEFYPDLLKFYYKDNIEEVKNIIKSLEDEIKENKNLEKMYKGEIKSYEKDILEKQNILNKLEEQIILEEKNIIPEDTRNDADYLKDRIELLKQEDRLDSLSKEQQYLYVDPDVIKEEIELLWNKKNNKNTEDVEIF